MTNRNSPQRPMNPQIPNPMNEFKYFTLQELIRSDVAAKKKIDNTPSFEVVDHLRELTKMILEPMRAAYGKAITVSSGYRCAALNAAVGGKNTSAHLRGDAADLQAADMPGFKKFVRQWLISQRIKFDQCIIERSGKTEWIHISIYSSTGSQRGQVFSLTV